MARIGLVMIVKDEEGNLAACLDSVASYVDEIVIVDTGSNDKTKQIAALYTPHVFDYIWGNDFSAARNFAIGKCTAEWVLALDADERLNGSVDLHDMVHNSQTDGFMMPLYCGNNDDWEEYERFSVLRLFRKEKGRYIGKIHEQVVIEQGDKIQFTDQPILYHKAVSSRERNARRHRNIILLRDIIKSEPENFYAKYYLGVEWFAFNKINMALGCFEEVVNKLNHNIIFFAPALKYYIDCLIRKRRLKEALAVCMEYAAQLPEYTDLYYYGGIILEEMEEYDAAIRWLALAIERGTPPHVFSHNNGTAGYLSLYHLGFCYERLGDFYRAKQYYEQALTNNPKFVIAIYPLFIRLLYDGGAETAYHYFSQKGHLERQKDADIIAGLFFTAYLPGYACRIVARKSQCNLAYHDADIKYLLCYGNTEYAAEILARWNGEQDSKEFFTIVKLLVEGRSSDAQQLSRRLWTHSGARNKALVLFNLSSFIYRKDSTVHIEQNRLEEYYQILLSLLDDFSRGSLKNIAIVKSICAVICEMEQGRKSLSDYYRRRISMLNQVLHYQLPQARNLYS